MNAPRLTVFACLSASLAPFALGQAETQLTASDPAQFGRFGLGVSLDGARTVVGATGAVTGGATTGAAYVFDAANGQQTRRLSVTDADNGRFGDSVAIDGNKIFVSAFFRNEIGATPADFFTRAGAVYVFDATSGQQLSMWLASDTLPHAHFGQSLAVEGGLAAVGSRASTGFGVEPGAVYIIDTQTGQELHKLFASDGEDEDGLGEEVDLDGGLMVSGARGDDDNGSRSGSAYVFDAITGVQLAKLVSSDNAAGDSFGVSVAIEGNRVAIGAHRDDDNGTDSGSVYIFDATTGTQMMKLIADDGQPNDLFGQTVVIEGGRVIVGAPQSDELANSSGSVYVFDLATGLQLSKFMASNGGEQHYFGYSLAAHRDRVAVGAPFAELSLSTEGAAYAFDLDGGPNGVVSYCDPITPNAASSTGALLSSTGDFGGSTATFNISHVPNTFGLLFAGDMEANVTLGCGARCVGGNIIRGSVNQAQNNQVLGATFDMQLSGSTHIQYWFRDLAPCGAGSNLSNALTR